MCAGVGGLGRGGSIVFRQGVGGWLNYLLDILLSLNARMRHERIETGLLSGLL